MLEFLDSHEDFQEIYEICGLPPLDIFENWSTCWDLSGSCGSSSVIPAQDTTTGSLWP